MRTVLAILAVIGGIIGGFMLFGALAESSAPRQAALAAIALCFTIIPYCLYRIANDDAVRENLQLLQEALAKQEKSS